jgi:hypothetical protein
LLVPPKGWLLKFGEDSILLDSFSRKSSRHPPGWCIDVDKHLIIEYNLNINHPLTIQKDGVIQERANMSVQKNISLQVANPREKTQSDFAAPNSAGDCDIDIQVTNGWIVTGHYKNNMLQSITLQKTVVVD